MIDGCPFEEDHKRVVKCDIQDEVKLEQVSLICRLLLPHIEQWGVDRNTKALAFYLRAWSGSSYSMGIIYLKFHL